jgi:hypothetical protein
LEDCKIATFKTYKGFYKPNNPKKYKGDPTTCVYRSLWERRFMQYCDLNESVISWSSEEIVVPYRSPIDEKIHRYFVDFWIKTKDITGTEKCMLIEIKPKNMTQKPVIQENKKMSKTSMIKMRDWIINNAKWEAARQYCLDRKWEFKILTEQEIFGVNQGE